VGGLQGSFVREQYGGKSRGAAAFMYAVVELAEDDAGEVRHYMI
jgi:hypothetical protein